MILYLILAVYMAYLVMMVATKREDWDFEDFAGTCRGRPPQRPFNDPIPGFGGTPNLSQVWGLGNDYAGSGCCSKIFH